MRGIVLAAGEGRRNRPLTRSRPKVMLPVGNRPLLEHVLRALHAAQVTDVTIVVGYKAESIQTHFQDGQRFGLRIRYVRQPKPAGTADAFWRGLDAGDQDDVLVVPGDTYIGPGVLRHFLAAAGRQDALLYTVGPDPRLYGVVEADDDAVVSVLEKPEHPARSTISTGIVKLSAARARGVRAFRSDGEAGLTRFLHGLAAKRPRLRAVPLEGAWFDVDRPENLLGANALHLAETKGHVGGTVEPGASLVGEVRVGKGSRILSGSYLVGPVVVGDGCEIGPQAVVYGPTSIGDNVTVGPFTELLECVVLADCRIASGCTLHHVVLDQGVILAPRVSMDRAHAVAGPSFGAVVGEGTILGNNVVVEPGSVLGSEVRVAPQKVVAALPDGTQVV